MKKNPLLLALIGIVLLGVAFVAYRMVGDSLSGETFPVSMYRENPRNLSGNRYQLDAQIDAQLGMRQNVGRLISVIPVGESGGAIPVFLPSALQQNLQVGQRYRMVVSVDGAGLLEVENLSKY